LNDEETLLNIFLISFREETLLDIFLFRRKFLGTLHALGTGNRVKVNNNNVADEKRQQHL